MSDETEDVYIFGYLSILASGSLATSVGLGAQTQQLVPARLPGYVRRWSAVRYFATNVSKRYVHAEDWRAAERVAFATLESTSNAVANGICFRIPSNRLAGLDFREQGYERVDISAKIEPYAGYELSKQLRCYTYVDPNPEWEPAIVSRAYYDMGRLGAASIDLTVPGFLEDYLSSTDEPAKMADDLAFVFFSNDAQHLWLLEESDSSLVLLHKFTHAQFLPSSSQPAEAFRHVTSGLSWLDARSRALSDAAEHRRVPKQMIQDLQSAHVRDRLAVSTYWLCRLIAADIFETSFKELERLANDPDSWVRRTATLRLQSR